ncbi:MAG: Mur ligase family protein [Devosia sp.]
MIDLFQIKGALRSAARRTKETMTNARNAVFMPLWRRQARARRDRMTGEYFVVMGSSGKSTATMLCQALFDAQRPTGVGMYYNNERMVLRHMRQWTRKVDIFIQELSEYPMGTIAAVAATMEPRGALVTSIGLDHRSTFRTHESILEQMVPLVRQLPPYGFLCLNADDPSVRMLAASASGRVILFGEAKDADLRLERIKSTLAARLSFDLVEGGRRTRVQTRFLGRLLLPSIGGALAMVRAAGLDLDAAIARLAAIEPLPNRMGIYEGEGGHTYVVDTYKSPLWSTRLLIDDIPNITSSDRILILGDISDMAGDKGKKYRQLIRQAADNCTLVIATGSAAVAAEVLLRTEPARANLLVEPTLSGAFAKLKGLSPAVIVVKGDGLRPPPGSRRLGAENGQ